MLADPNAELLKQLARIADALSKPAPSPWVEWVQTLASFVVGMAVSYFTIMFQNRTGDRHERRKMRQIVYRELTDSVLNLCSIVDNMSGLKPLQKSGSEHSIDPPSARMLNPPFTFAGEDYMRQNHDVSYGLPEMVDLKRMYSDLRQFSAGTTVSLGQFKLPLMHFGQSFKSQKVIRNSFKKFAGEDFPAIEAIANHFSDYRIKPGEVMRIVFRSKESENDDQSPSN